MTVKLVFIGKLEDLAGEAERLVQPTETMEDLLDTLEPELARELRGEKIRVAVNGGVLADARRITMKDGDEIAFLPPVSGG